MHFSMIVACLVLFVAISDVSAQWGQGHGQRSHKQFGVSGGLRVREGIQVKGGLLSRGIQEECYCHNEDYCVRSNGQLMCQSVTGQFYAPISRLGQAGRRFRVSEPMVGQVRVSQPIIDQVRVNQPMIGQVRLSQPIVRQTVVNQGLPSCCLRDDFQVCAVQGFPTFLNMNRNMNMNMNSYIQGGICSKYYFNGKSCQSINVYTTCVAEFNPRNLFGSIELCQAKCASGY